MSEFTPAWFARGPHLQTIWGRIVRPRRLAKLRRETVETPDGDELVLDHLDGDVSIRFLLLHGLEGSSNSVYMQGLLAAIARHGFAATAINFRSCALDDRGRTLPNRRPRFYHSGETGDFDFVARLLAAREPSTRRVAVGASLGGNVLLKWLGENPGQQLIAAAAAFSVPFDLGAGARHISRLYVVRFLRTLKKKIVQMLERFPANGHVERRDRRPQGEGMALGDEGGESREQPGTRARRSVGGGHAGMVTGSAGVRAGWPGGVPPPA